MGLFDRLFGKKEEAEAIKAKLVEAGATVEIK